MHDDRRPDAHARDSIRQERERPSIFDRIHRSPRIPDRYAARRALNR